MDLNWNCTHASSDAIEERAEAYVLHRLPPRQVAQFEEHLLWCERCREAVDLADEFIQVFRLSMKDLDPLAIEIAFGSKTAARDRALGWMGSASRLIN